MFSYLINRAIDDSLGARDNKLGVAKTFPKFYHNNFISKAEFRSKVRTGDIIIFRGLEYGPKMQRCFTRDDYDHIALIIRDVDNELKVYEANAVGSCQLFRWDNFLNHLCYLFFEKIALRQLFIENKEEEPKIRKKLFEQMSEFIGKTLKKKYNLNAKYIICPGKAREIEFQNNWDQEEGFNCSSLVAAAYYSFGIIKVDRDSRSILPGKFAEDKSDSYFQFLNGFSLGEEEIIDFSE